LHEYLEMECVGEAEGPQVAPDPLGGLGGGYQLPQEKKGPPPFVTPLSVASFVWLFYVAPF
jgi:hypothetical protein